MEISGVTGEFPRVLQEVPAVLRVVPEVLEEFPGFLWYVGGQEVCRKLENLKLENHMHDCSTHTHIKHTHTH